MTCVLTPNTTTTGDNTVDASQSAIAYIRLNWMDRADVVALLEGIDIQCDDDEDKCAVLHPAVISAIEDGDLSLDDLPTSGTAVEARYAE